MANARDHLNYVDLTDIIIKKEPIFLFETKDLYKKCSIRWIGKC